MRVRPNRSPAPVPRPKVGNQRTVRGAISPKHGSVTKKPTRPTRPTKPADVFERGLRDLLLRLRGSSPEGPIGRTNEGIGNQRPHTDILKQSLGFSSGDDFTEKNPAPPKRLKHRRPAKPDPRNHITSGNQVTRRDKIG